VRVAITCGDPLGIGAEVAVVAASRVNIEVVLIGPADLWDRAAALRGVDLAGLEIEPPPPVPDAPAAWAGLPELAAIAAGVQGCLDGRFDALCTAPIHKAPLLAAGFPHPGHTGWLGALCGAPAVMLFAGGRLRVALVTTHVPLARVPALITVERVVNVTRIAAAEVARGLGVESPRVAICGLNPHAGEDGKLGSEDDAVLRPAVARLVAEGVDASGPHPADTVFGRALRGEFDLVIAQYHDQGLIPVKTVDFGRSVNITAGLPIVRTSVDHGTARDIAWTGRADAGPMEAAIRMAERLASGRR
jgi:4-hydroxythreonine-4-phosphate dehydrogenase